MLGSRRHRPPPSQPLTAATAHPNAAMAAAAVFNRPAQQQPSLSAAAAAAALRARPITPTNVGGVQTKRTMRRTASVSSSGTAPDVQGRPGLQRRGSNASMTERTFRSPSPGGRRPSSSGGDGVSTQRASSREPAPPVPALPKHVDKLQNAPQQKTQSLGLSSPPLRLASQTLGKPGAGSWFGAAQVGDLGSVRTSDAAMASPPLSPPPQFAHPTDDERPDSRSSSVNFSYPSRVRVGSPPPASPTTTRGFDFRQASKSQDRAVKRASSGASSTRARPHSVSSVESLVYDPNSRRMVPRAEVYPPSQDFQGSTGRSPSLRKKKKQPPKTGTHFAQATMGRTKVSPAGAAYGAAYEHAQEPQGAPLVAETARHDEPQSRYQQEQTKPPRVEDEANGRVGHEPVSPKPTEAGRVPFATHAARNLVTPSPQGRPQDPQERDADDEPAVKSLISAPRSEATKNEQQRPQQPLPTADQADNADEVGSPREFTWVGQGVRRQPSTVKEEPEPEDEEPQSPRRHSVAVALDNVPTRQKVYPPSSGEAQSSVIDHQPDSHVPVSTQHPGTSENLRATETSPAPAPKQPATLQTPNSSSLQRERSVSSSPARTARFGSVQDNLTVKHCPPPRSVSPRKSALKQSTSPDRRASIDDNISEASSTVNQREDPALTRKKSVRVSWDDSNTVVVGESQGPNLGDSPVIASPQNSARRPWYSNIGRAKKQELLHLDDDEVMKPRPVLPSFGSVRDKKPRDNATGHEERPLVRPVTDASNSPSIPASPVAAPTIPSTGEDARPETPLNITAAGSEGSSQAESDRRAKIAANTSRFREPLPPVVTSIEGSGYVSDTASSDDGSTQVTTAGDTGRKEEDLQSPTDTEETTPASSQPPTHQALTEDPLSLSVPNLQDSSSAPEGKGKGVDRDIPTIAISQPTPPATRWPSNRYFDVPGGFPEDDSEASTPGAVDNPVSMVEVRTSTLVRETTFEPVSQLEDKTQTPHTPATVAATLAPITDDDEDESSIYSDASDHFTDTENGGFMSLDAVVESPLPSQAKKAETGPGLPSSTAPHLGTELSSATTAVETTQQGDPPVQLDWDKAKAYWRSLTAEKRAQLEKEALNDAGVDGDVEESPGGAQKPKKKKSIERRNSERKALAVHLAQQTISAQQQKQAQEDHLAAANRQSAVQPGDAERTYMIKPGTKVGTDRAVSHPAEQPKASVKGTDAAPRMRASMRTNGSVSKSAHSGAPRAHALGGKTMRSTPAEQPARASKATKPLQRVSSPPTATAAARSSFNPPPLRRRGSDSSESSFRRSSRPQSAQGSFGFRKTLRQPSPSQSDRAGRRPSGRFSLRSMSPPSPLSRSAPSISGSMGMRQSLRGPPPDDAKSNRGSMTFGGFRKSSGKGGAKPKSKAGSSRFSDSSDDDAAPSTFRSRFGASSDEDEDDGRSAPSRGQIEIPKTMRSGRGGRDNTSVRRYAPAAELSPALPEEEEEESEDDHVERDEEKEFVSPLPPGRKVSARSGRGGLIAASPTAASPVAEAPKAAATRRGSFMSVLRRKKNKTGGGGIVRPEPMDSAARRDTKLERTPGELRELRRSGDLDREDEEAASEVALAPPPAPRSPRLQKRTHTNTSIGSAVGGGTWPLASPRGGGEEDERDPLDKETGNLGTRTVSGPGAGGAGRPVLFHRRTVSSTVQGGFVGGDGGSVVGTLGGTERKKKKFGALRKMFGLDD